jgi:hypothetical protein
MQYMFDKSNKKLLERAQQFLQAHLNAEAKIGKRGGAPKLGFDGTIKELLTALGKRCAQDEKENGVDHEAKLGKRDLVKNAFCSNLPRINANFALTRMQTAAEFLKS